MCYLQEFWTLVLKYSLFEFTSLASYDPEHVQAAVKHWEFSWGLLLFLISALPGAPPALSNSLAVFKTVWKSVCQHGQKAALSNGRDLCEGFSCP
jgi:hypothetical protein